MESSKLCVLAIEEIVLTNQDLYSPRHGVYTFLSLGPMEPWVVGQIESRLDKFATTLHALHATSLNPVIHLKAHRFQFEDKI
jgi:hypothetical protein